jgi:hypothetical protein
MAEASRSVYFVRGKVEIIAYARCNWSKTRHLSDDKEPVFHVNFKIKKTLSMLV